MPIQTLSAVPSLALLRALRSLTVPSISRTRGPCSQFRSRPFSAQANHCSPPPSRSSRPLRAQAPVGHDRGPVSTETTQTDFSAMDIFGSSNTPATAIDACTPHGFHLNNGIKTTGGAGIALLGGEAFLWSPFGTSTKENGRKSGDESGGGSASMTLAFPARSLAILEVLHPKPDLVLVGTGKRVWPLTRETREALARLGVRVDVMDTRSASAAFNLLATERGVSGVGGLLLPVGWSGMS